MPYIVSYLRVRKKARETESERGRDRGEDGKKIGTLFLKRMNVLKICHCNYLYIEVRREL
jgi:hypothetical protein